MVGASAVNVGTASLYDPGAPARISRELDEVLNLLGEPSVSSLIGTLAGGGSGDSARITQVDRKKH